MDDIASKLTAFLEDDRSVDLLKSFAGSAKKEGGGGIDPAALGAFAKMAQGDDDRVRLIRALKPFVSEQRGQSIDEIARMLQIGEVIMMLFAKGNK